MQDIQKQAIKLLVKIGQPQSFLTHRRLIGHYGQQVHLFRGKCKGKTTRYLGILGPSGTLSKLLPITNNERKYIGRSGQIDVLARRTRLSTNRRRASNVRRRKLTEPAAETDTKQQAAVVWYNPRSPESQKRHCSRAVGFE